MKKIMKKWQDEDPQEKEASHQKVTCDTVRSADGIFESKIYIFDQGGPLFILFLCPKNGGALKVR